MTNQIDEIKGSLGDAMKKYRWMNRSSWDAGDPRDLKKRLSAETPERKKELAGRTGTLHGPAELQRRLAKRMTKESVTAADLVEHALTREPGEFGAVFGELMRDRLVEAVSSRKRAIAEGLLSSNDAETEEDKQEEADLETESVEEACHGNGVPDEAARVRENDARKAAKRAKLWKPKIVKPVSGGKK